MKTLALFIGLSLTSCTLTVSPDGTRHYSINGEVARAIIIQSTK